MWSKSKLRKEEVVRTDIRRGRTNKLCFTMRSSFFLCLYGWCPAMEETKSMLLWFFYLPLSEPVQVKTTSHLCGPHAVLFAAFCWIELFVIVWWPLSSFTVSDFTCALSGVCATSYIFFLLYVHGHNVFLSARIRSSGDMNLYHQYSVESCVFSSRLSFSWKPSPFVFKLITDC